MHLEIGDADFYTDLLFYHLRLRCFVEAELAEDPGPQRGTHDRRQ
ncbi:MAG: hypothetical protein ACSLE7_00275 [Mycobacterium sp.]